MDYQTASLSEQPFDKQSGRKRATGFRRFTRLLLAIIMIALAVFVYFRFFYVFGDGVKSGHLNYAVKKGNIFKTYEGKLIQEGIRSRTAGAIQSYEFEFSVSNERIYNILSANSGKLFDLHYKEYHGALPWRGNTKYVVDSIVSMRDE